MIDNAGTIIGTFGVYLGVILLMAVLAFRRTTNLSDFILGGRSLNRWVTALAAQASDMSGWLLMGLPGFAYLAGLHSRGPSPRATRCRPSRAGRRPPT